MDEMHQTTKIQLAVIGFALLLLIGFSDSVSAGKRGSTALQQRIDFGNAYIMGQSIKSGAVYLMHRKQNEIKSMLEYRNDYREEILEDFQIQDLNVDETQKNGERKKK